MDSSARTLTGRVYQFLISNKPLTLIRKKKSIQDIVELSETIQWLTL